jgi:hypothetical protein
MASTHANGIGHAFDSTKSRCVPVSRAQSFSQHSLHLDDIESESGSALIQSAASTPTHQAACCGIENQKRLFKRYLSACSSAPDVLLSEHSDTSDASIFHGRDSSVCNSKRHPNACEGFDSFLNKVGQQSSRRPDITLLPNTHFHIENTQPIVCYQRPLLYARCSDHHSFKTKRVTSGSSPELTMYMKQLVRELKSGKPIWL